MTRTAFFARLGGFLLLLLSLFAVPASAAEKVTVFAAASLKDVLTAISEAWKKESGNEAVLSFAGSSALAHQIAESAAADPFIYPALDRMDDVEKKGLVKDGSRVALLANRIVLVAPAGASSSLKIAP